MATSIDLTKKSWFNENTIIAFHIGRGGRFNNSGYCTILGEHNINDFTGDLFSPMDEEGNELEGEFTAENGSGVGLTTAEARTGIGRIDLDGEYDTTYTIFLRDLDINRREGEALRNAFEHNDGDTWAAENIVRWLCEGESDTSIDCILNTLDLEREEQE